ncbi:unnamed protein product [Ectocarpus sp. 12 AP-2014]
MSSPGGPRVGGSSGSMQGFFSACTGNCCHKNEMPSIGSDGKSTPPGQQSICSKCNRNFRRAADAKRNSDEYERCELCRNNGVGEWLQESCVVS